MKKYISSLLISFVLFANILMPISVFAADPTIKFELREDKENKETLKRSWELTIKTTGIEVGKDVSIKIFSEIEELQKATYKPVKIETGGVGYYSTGYILNPATKYKIIANYRTFSGSFEKITLGTSPDEAKPGEKWWFINEAKQVVGSNGVHGFPGFDTVLICDKARIPYKSTTTSSVSDCRPYSDAEINELIKQEKIASEKFTKEVINKEDPVPITPKIGATENSNVYKMLVPLPGITCMDNTGKDPNCIGNNIMGYLNFIFKFGIGLCAALAVIMLIVYGVMYMGDESVFAKTAAKEKMLGAILGLFIAIGAWVLLNTINPDLTGKNGFSVDQAKVTIVRDRADDPDFQQNISSFDTSNVIPLDYNDDLFLGYLAHQQGPSGAASIIWANNSGLTTVPAKNPFTSASVNTNMRNNFYASDAIRVIGTSELTPANFLKYWSLKIAASTKKTNPILPKIETALRKVAGETGVSFETLVAICRIESAAGCTSELSITKSNGSFQGLFQIGQSVWKDYGNKNGNILDPYENALAAAKYYKSNVVAVRNKIIKGK